MLLEPLPGWSPLAAAAERTPASFVSGEPDGERLRVRYFRRDADGALVGKAWFGPGAVGPPGFAHGGSMAAILDEAMGGAAWLAGHRVLAAKLTINFRRMLPLGTVALFAAWVVEARQRKVRMAAELSSDGGDAFATAEGLFIEMDAERHAAVLAEARAVAPIGAERG